ncbi:SH3 domain-containing protein [Neobacillus terrae]|uniref:SH3 domain-containing protein n=1 Tax=Neobacillus terrae TaxID=3034837 RepID=UPI001408AF8C|nr:SH3 domain-containing protein [Neobacillus terrae]NHM30438.1 SH3 domain-containing protein [Neobacillus terrae]
MLKKLAIVLISAALFSAIIFPEQKIIAAKSSIRITADNLNVRGGPGLSYPVVKQVKIGDQFTLIKEEGQWYKIDLGYGRKGWVANWFASKSQQPQPSFSNSSSGSYAEVNTNGLRVRKGPGTSFQITDYLDKGEKVTILETNASWNKISGSFGSGWVSREFLSPLSKEATKPGNSTSETGKVIADSLNIRNTPSLDGEIIGKLLNGTEVKILSSQKSWLEINFSGKRGWVTSEFIKTSNSDSGNSTNNQPAGGIIGTVTATSLYVRQSSAVNAGIVGTVTKGEKFSILEELNNWAKIEYKKGNFGWIAGWYLDKSSAGDGTQTGQTVKESTITVLQNGTNIRKAPDLQSDVIVRANAGNVFPVKSIKGSWYGISLKNGTSAYIAGWMVSVSGSAPRIEKAGAEVHLKNKIIVLDPGHGGEDGGTIGANGTLEKNVTLRTASLLYDKLKAAGANVIMTRRNDTYISLRSRVSVSHYQGADAFVSIHFDSNMSRNARGMTGYYYHDYQKPLASYLYSGVEEKTGLKERGVRFGDYHVLRENKRVSTLLELGYLSNPEDEMLANSVQFQESASSGIYNGLARYFKEN